ncbi:MAG: Wzz/FepE/Etk N-terminal domain-containing protein [Bacteroidota bacterium]
MVQNENQNSDFNTTNFLLFLYKWRKPLIIIVLAAAVASAGFSFLITPKFKSTVIMFPTSTNAISKALLAENQGGKLDILEFGEEEQAEQMLQILNSNEIRSRVIRKFNLVEHYNIDPASKYVMTNLIEEYNSNITFRRTEYMAVEISVLDKDPQIAADIANTISDLLDSVKNKMQKERALKAYQIVDREYVKLQSDIRVMEDSLSKLRELGINDYETQSEAYNTQLAIALRMNTKTGVAAIEEKIKILGQYGGAYVSLRDQLDYFKKQLGLIKAKYEEAKVDYEQELPAKFIVDRAYKSERKTYPVRWMIVTISSLAALLLSVLVLIIFDSFSKKKDSVQIKRD